MHVQMTGASGSCKRLFFARTSVKQLGYRRPTWKQWRMHRPDRESGADEYGRRPDTGDAPNEYSLDSCRLGIVHSCNVQWTSCVASSLTSSSLHVAWGVANAKCILATAVCVSVWLSVCLSLAAFPHYCTDPDVTCGGMVGVLSICALLAGFAIGVRV